MQTRQINLYDIMYLFNYIGVQLHWRHLKVMASQIISFSTICCTTAWTKNAQQWLQFRKKGPIGWHLANIKIPLIKCSYFFVMEILTPVKMVLTLLWGYISLSCILSQYIWWTTFSVTYRWMRSVFCNGCFWLIVASTGPILCHINSLRPRQNGRPFADDTFKRILLNENIRISTTNSLKFVPKGLINIIPALVLIWLGADQATSHYLNQYWLDHWRIYASLGLNELMRSFNEDKSTFLRQNRVGYRYETVNYIAVVLFDPSP